MFRESKNEIKYTTKEEALIAVKEDGMNIKYCSGALRSDKQVLILAVSNDDSALFYADKTLKNDKEFILDAVAENGDALHFASDELRNDKEVCLEAVKNNGNSLKYVSQNLKDIYGCNPDEFIFNAEADYGDGSGSRDRLKLHYNAPQKRKGIYI